MQSIRRTDASDTGRPDSRKIGLFLCQIEVVAADERVTIFLPVRLPISDQFADLHSHLVMFKVEPIEKTPTAGAGEKADFPIAGLFEDKLQQLVRISTGLPFRFFHR